MKQKSLAQFKKRLWPLFSFYIKKRDGQRCMACGKIAKGQNLHAGHLIPRSICGVVLTFHPLNCYSECAACNIWAGGNGALLAENVSRKLGFNITEQLAKIRKETKKVQWDRKVLEALILCLQNGGNYEKEYDEIYGL